MGGVSRDLGAGKGQQRECMIMEVRIGMKSSLSGARGARRRRERKIRTSWLGIAPYPRISFFFIPPFHAPPFMFSRLLAPKLSICRSVCVVVSIRVTNISPGELFFFSNSMLSLCVITFSHQTIFHFDVSRFRNMSGASGATGRDRCVTLAALSLFLFSCLSDGLHDVRR